MPAKKACNVLPKYIAAIRRGGKNVGYKYQRRVPKRVWQMAELTGDTDYPKMHDIYLSANLTEAVRKAQELTALHDEQFAKMLTPEGGVAHLTTRIVTRAVEASKEATPSEKRVMWGDSWRDWKKMLTNFGQDATRFDDTAKADYLASCLASSFGLRELVADIASPYARALAERETGETIPPEDMADLVEFNAAKAMLLDQYDSLKPKRPAPEGQRLSDRVTQYGEFAALKKETRASMKKKVNRFIRYLGRDPNMDSIDTATVKEYRDALAADPNLSRSTVNAYLTPLRTLYRWGVDEGFAKADPTITVRSMKDDQTIEDKQWHPFDDSQIQTVWRLVQEHWGPNGKSRLSESRKTVFMSAFRVMLYTGMRPAEVFRLTPADVYEDRIEAKNTKTGPRTVALADAIKNFHALIHSPAWTDALTNEQNGKGSVSNLQRTMSESFTGMIRDAGLRDPKHVLYSTKSTLVRALNRLEAPDNVQRSIIGHKTPGKLRHYTSPAELRTQLQYLNQVRYCEGLGA